MQEPKKRRRSPNKGQFDYHNKREDLRCNQHLTKVLDQLTKTGKTFGLSKTAIIHLAVQKLAYEILEAQHYPDIEKIIHVRNVLPFKNNDG